MTTLRVVIDPILDPSSRSTARYAEDLTRALILTAPRGCEVQGIVSASPEPEYDELLARLPGLTALIKTALSRRELVRAWQHGVTTLPGSGMIHATSLLAPLRRHDRLNTTGEQIVVTVHDVAPWSAPDSVEGRSASWFRSMAKRAEKHADAVVVPTHALADELLEFVDFGDRIRVIPPAPSSTLRVPADAAQRAERLRLPSTYLLTSASVSKREGLTELLEAIRDLDVQLVILGTADRDVTLATRLAELHIPAGRVTVLHDLDEADYATALDRATAFVDPAVTSGSGAPVLDALQLGTPVVAAEVPQLVELVADAALLVPRDDYPRRLRAALESVLSDAEVRRTLSILGQDRARAFSWAGAAEKVWQLHADL